mgnify:CR=1 FL=1
MVDKRTVEYVAHLARISIDEKEKEQLTYELSRIIDYIDKLKELNVDGISPTRGGFSEVNIFRQDKAEKKSYFNDILKNAPSQENNHFKIPKVIE